VKRATKGTTPKASQLITKYISDTGDWRGTTLAKLRKIILEASPELVEEWKWGSPVWSQNGPVCSAGAFKGHVKLNFFRGASLKDPQRLFNAGLDAKTMRAIDFHQGGKIDASAIKALVRAAVAQNASGME
jgi:hypothetical protein